jgi:hypothetical protein
MRRRLTVLMAAATLAWAGLAHAKLPRDVDEFRERLAKEAVKPEGAAKLWFEAIYVYAKDASRDEGRKMLALLMLDEKWEKNTYFVDRMRTKPHIYRSYAKGSTPENRYAMDPDSFALVVASSAKDKFREHGWRLTLKSGGDDEPRPLVLVKGTDNLWRIQAYNEVYGDIKPPAG